MFHAGAKGNERAGSLASIATMSDSREMDLAEILEAVENIGQIDDSGGKLDSMSLAHLCELII